MRNITLFILVFLLFSCEQKKSKYETTEIVTTDEIDNQLENYIQNPAITDSLCISDIEKAKNEIALGKLVFSIPMSFGTFRLRQEKQIIELCKTYDLAFEYELFGCMVTEGQTRGCYGAYMNKAIEDKYGKGFNNFLLAKAQSMMLASNDTIEYYLCDTKPEIAGKGNYSTTIEVKVPEKLSKQLKTDKNGYSPFMDIGFYIDKSGNASGYFLNYFMDADSTANYKFKDELFKIGVDELKMIKQWKTGIVAGQKVNTENNIRIHF